MHAPPMSAVSIQHELSRIQTVRSLTELDTTSDATLNDLIRVAAHALDCPVASVCLSEEDRHWVKASHGLELYPALDDPRFHLQTVRERDLLVVSDATLDPRFADSPLGLQHQGVRFYAGAPLRVSGHVVGTLCLSAPQPRTLSSLERVVLTDLAHAVEHWFVSRREQVRLQAREREFRELAEQMPGIVYRAALNDSSATLYISSRVRELGYTVEEWTASPDTWLNALHPADREQTLEQLALGLQRGQPFELTYRLRTRDGVWRHYQDVIRIVASADDEGPLIQGVMLDVTDRAMAQAERELLLHDLPDGVLLLDARQRITDANPQAQRLLGKSLDQLRHRHIGHLFSEGESQMGAEQDAWTLDNHADTLDWTYWHPDGRLRTFEDRRRMIEGGAEVRVLRDVTHRRKEAGWLRMLAQAAEQATEAIVITDLTANIVYVNQAMTKASGYSRAELIGKNSRLLQSGLTPAVRYRKLWESLTAGQPWRGFLNNRRKDGANYIEFAVISPVRDEVGRITHYLAVKEDITEKRRMGEDLARYQQQLDELVAQRTEELERARRSAERASAAKSSFLASMSHEIRTPMNGVIGIADVLMQSGLSPHQKDLVETIHESAHVLLSLIDDILDFSKIEAGRLELACTPFDLGRLVEHTCNAVQPLAADKRVYLHVFTDPALTPQWLGDATRVRQILLNLVGNAIKFSAGLNRLGRVSLCALAAPGGGVRLVVQDNGIGMAEDVQQRIFKPFVQGELSTTSNYGGTGLGLVICQRLVEAMGGSIGLSSAPGVGSTFTVDLPLSAIAGEQTLREIDLKGLHCHLEVEQDDPATHWQRYLEAVGATTSVGESGRALLAGQGTPVLILSEAGRQALPESLNGVPQVRLRNLTRDVPSLGAGGHVVLHTHGMHRSDLLQAVAMAARRLSPPTRAPAPQAEQPEDLREAAAGRLVLVAEDNDINQKVIAQQLALLGLSSEVVADGRVALDRWQQAPGRYALLLTDLRMPGMDGVALTRAIRDAELAGQHLPVLALTANAQGGESQRCLESGMDGYLSKPVTLEQLRSALQPCLKRLVGASTAPMVQVPAEALPIRRHSDPVFDDGLPERLLGDDAQLLAELRLQFVQASGLALDEILSAANSNDWARVGFVAHRIKSSAHATGAVGLWRLLDGLEQAVRDLRFDDAKRCVAGLEAVVALVREHFTALSSGVPGVRLALMCVDDDPTQLQSLSRLAHSKGLPEPQMFSTGAALLSSLRGVDSQGLLLMVDLLMPQMDGVELIRHLGDIGFAGGVVLCSGADSSVMDAAEYLLKSHGIRCLGHLAKPVIGEQLGELWRVWRAQNPSV